MPTKTYELSESQINRIRDHLYFHNLKDFENLSFSPSQSSRIREIIERLQESDNQGTVNLSDIVVIAEILDIDKFKAEDMVNKLKDAGWLIELRPGRFKIVS